MKTFFVNSPVMVLYDWLAKRVQLPWSSDFCALGRVVDGNLVGVVGYCGFTGTSCEMHMAGEPGWMTREFIFRTFYYPFVQLGLLMVIGRVTGGNTRALDIDRRLGFKERLHLPEAHPDGGIHILTMHRDDCRWIKGYEHGR